MSLTDNHRVAIIEDDPWVRAGKTTALRSHPDISEVHSLSFVEALSGICAWPMIDVAVVDPFDIEQPFDRFAGVGVARAIRMQSPATEIVVVSDHPDNEYLHLRLTQCGADFHYGRRTLHSRDSLIGAVLDPQPGHRLRPATPQALAVKGLRADGRPDEFLDHLTERRAELAFTEPVPQHETGLSRRAIINLRMMAATVGGLRCAPSACCGGPQQRGGLPTWREVVAYVRRLTGLELRGC